MITEIKHIILNFQLNIEKIEFVHFLPREPLKNNSNTFLVTVNGLLVGNGKKILTKQLIITN